MGGGGGESGIRFMLYMHDLYKSIFYVYHFVYR